MYDLPKGCSECGQLGWHSAYCSKNPIKPPKSDYDRGFDDGYGKPKLGCSECGQIVGHRTYCSKNPITWESDYERGYKAGRRAAGISGQNSFDYSGD